MSFQPVSSGGGGSPSMLTTRNWTSCTWKLCGPPCSLCTTQLSTVSTVTVASIRSRSMSSPLMLVPLSSELARGRHVAGGQVGRVRQGVGHRGGRRERVGGPQLEDVEPVVAALEPAAAALPGLLAAQHDVLARRHRDHDLGPLARREPELVDRRRGGEQPAVGADDVEVAVVGEAEVVAAGVGGVEQPQPHPFGA